MSNTSKGDTTEATWRFPSSHRRLVIVGAGGHGRELYATARSAQQSESGVYEVIGFVDDGSPDLSRLERLGSPLLGTTGDVLSLGADYIIGVGDGSVRRSIDERLRATGAIAAEPIVHSGAWIGPDVVLGRGVVICFGVSVTTNVTIGRHVHLNRGATVGHDCRLDDYVTMAPLSAISGDVSLRMGCDLGTGASVLPGVTVGEGSRVGAGAVVTFNIDAGVTTVGIPARALPLSSLLKGTASQLSAEVRTERT